MAHCSEIIVLREVTRKFQEDGTSSVTDRAFFELADPSAELTLDWILQPFGSNSTQFLWSLERTLVERGLHPPWAVIALDREYRLAGHFRQVRGDPSKMPFSSYSLLSGPPPPGTVPPISMIYVMEKSALRAAAGRTPLLESAWSALAEKPEDRHWLCLAEPLPEDWVAETERDDDLLFMVDSNCG